MSMRALPTRTGSVKHLLSPTQPMWSRTLKSLLVKTLAFVSISLAPTIANAQDIVRFGNFYVDRANPSYIFLDGPIDDRSGLSFARILEASGDAHTLVLASDGGLVYVGLTIAQEVRRRGLATYVPANARCYSACSYLWFAGVERDAHGEVGVHQIASRTADLSTGQLAIGDIIDVLANFGVPNEVFVAMLQTPSSEMYVLDRAKLNRYGLIGSTVATSAPPAPSATVTTASTREREAIAFVASNIRDWSLPNDEALSRAGQYYASEVDFYGSVWSRERVLQDKRALANRWPVRNYALDVSTATATCSPTTCTVAGEVVWRAHSPERNATSSGRSTVDLTLAIRSHGFAIVREDGSVIQRD